MVAKSLMDFSNVVLIILVTTARVLAVGETDPYPAASYDGGDGAYNGDRSKYTTLIPLAAGRHRFSYRVAAPPTSFSKIARKTTYNLAHARAPVIRKDSITIITARRWSNPLRKRDKVSEMNARNPKPVSSSYTLHITGRLICPGKFTMADHVLVLACDGRINKGRKSSKTFSNPGGFFRLNLRMVDDRPRPYLLLFHYCSNGQGIFRQRISRYRMEYAAPPTGRTIDIGVVDLLGMRSRPAFKYPVCRQLQNAEDTFKGGIVKF